MKTFLRFMHVENAGDQSEVTEIGKVVEVECCELVPKEKDGVVIEGEQYVVKKRKFDYTENGKVVIEIFVNKLKKLHHLWA